MTLIDPRVLGPEHWEVQKTVCCLCCASAPIVLTVTLPKRQCCIGETLPVHVTIENGSSRRITLHASLYQCVVYFAEDHRDYRNKILVGVVSDEIAPRITHEWDTALQIPTTEVLDERSCSIIQVSHSLEITAAIPWALDLFTTYPVKLGNVYEQLQLEEDMPPSHT